MAVEPTSFLVCHQFCRQSQNQIYRQSQGVPDSRATCVEFGLIVDGRLGERLLGSGLLSMGVHLCRIKREMARDEARRRREEEEQQRQAAAARAAQEAEAARQAEAAAQQVADCAFDVTVVHNADCPESSTKV